MFACLTADVKGVYFQEYCRRGIIGADIPLKVFLLSNWWFKTRCRRTSWGQSAADAVVTSISNPCGDFKGSGDYLRLGAPGLPKEYDFWCAMKGAKTKVLTLFITGRFLPLKVHIPMTFSSEKYYLNCIVIAKTFVDLTECTMDLILWQYVVTDCVRPRINTTPFEVTRQDKISHWANILEDTAAGQPGRSTGVPEA